MAGITFFDNLKDFVNNIDNINTFANKTSISKKNSDICRTWYVDENDQYHREDGPAYFTNDGSYKVWIIHGKKHRLDGPAIEYIGGGKQWYINDKYINCVNQEEFEQLIKDERYNEDNKNHK